MPSFETLLLHYLNQVYGFSSGDPANQFRSAAPRKMKLAENLLPSFDFVVFG
jgi:hypothetical protein